MTEPTNEQPKREAWEERAQSGDMGVVFRMIGQYVMTSAELREIVSVALATQSAELERAKTEIVRMALIGGRDTRDYVALKADLAKCREELAAVKDVAREARDTVEASICESGISDGRREYRKELKFRIDALLK